MLKQAGLTNTLLRASALELLFTLRLHVVAQATMQAASHEPALADAAAFQDFQGFEDYAAAAEPAAPAYAPASPPDDLEGGPEGASAAGGRAHEGAINHGRDYPARLLTFPVCRGIRWCCGARRAGLCTGVAVQCH